MTHVDADHIEGVLKLLNDRALGMRFADTWFNGYRHLPIDELGAAQGEMLSAVIETRGLAWNAKFGGGPVEADRAGRLPCVELAGGFRLTLLTPGRPELVRLRKGLEREIPPAGLAPGSTRAELVQPQRMRRLTTLGNPP